MDIVYSGVALRCDKAANAMQCMVPVHRVESYCEQTFTRAAPEDILVGV